jgi:3,5-epimerase/4-reductase
MESAPSIVKKFAVTKLSVGGADLIESPVFKDNRGSLYEAFHCLKFDDDCTVRSVKGIYPHMGEVYGPLAVNSDETVYIVRGKIICALVDPNDAKVTENVELVPGKVLKIPSGLIRAYYALEEKSIFHIVQNSGDGECKYFKLTDAEVAGIKWPETEKPLKQADLMAPTEENLKKQEETDFAIMGSTGLIGNAFVREIENQSLTWKPIRARLHQHEMIKAEILAHKPRISVIIAAGVGTRPNANWCNDHHLETIDANITSQFAIVKMCKEIGVHCAIITTAGFYSYDKDHMIGGPGFTETDPANRAYNFYYKCRVRLEKILVESGYDKNVLILRANYPCDHLIRPASLIGKLLRYPVIRSIPASITVLNDLVPLAIQMLKDKDSGIVNWVCNGTITNGDILRIYASIVDSSKTFNEEVLNEKQSWDAGNAAAYVIPKRLLDKFGDKVPKVKDSITKIMNLIKESDAK